MGDEASNDFLACFEGSFMVSVFLAVKELVELKESCTVPLSLAVEETKKSLHLVTGVPVRESIKEFLVSKNGLGLSKRHLEDLASSLGRFRTISANLFFNEVKALTWASILRKNCFVSFRQ